MALDTHSHTWIETEKCRIDRQAESRKSNRNKNQASVFINHEAL